MEWIFRIFFGVLGSQLSRCKQFVFQLRVFGFYVIWTMIRLNTLFVDAEIFELLLRCTLSAGLGAITTIMIKAEELVDIYTIITVGSRQLINVVDPYFRRIADCKGIGPPTPKFLYGVWVDCGNWKFAYVVTWINSLFVYLLLGIFLILKKYCTKNIPFLKPVKRMSGYVAVAMVATNSAGLFITALNRREKIHNEYYDTFVQWSYYILLGTFCLTQELIHCVWKCREKRMKRKIQ